MNKYFKIVLVVLVTCKISCIYAQEEVDTIVLNTLHSFATESVEGYSYMWWFTDPNGSKTEFTSKSNRTEDYLWDTEGSFLLSVQATDIDGCLSEIKRKEFFVKKEETELVVSAGADTLIGSCSSCKLQSTVYGATDVVYKWEPSVYLNDAKVANPVFTPGVTTTYQLTVTSDDGQVAVDEVTVTVVEESANAGDDIVVEGENSVNLSALASFGEGLSYTWTTDNGLITNGENTATPEITTGGVYSLTVIDAFGCTSNDAIAVTWIADAPEEYTDYDTTKYETPVSIPVLDNDELGNSGEEPVLSIIYDPSNGSASVNSDNTILYAPDNEFYGDDVFEYRVCVSQYLCYNVYVYVNVTDNLLVFPEAFTPNGDGINDFYEITNVEFYTNNTFTVINRWGKTVYKAKHYGIDTDPKFWNGTSSKVGGNIPLPVGTYFYVFDPGNGEKRVASFIYLDR